MMKETFLGVDVAPVTYKRVISEISRNIDSGEQSTIVAVNPEKVMEACKDEKVRELINSSTLQIPDGIGIVWASKWRGGQIRERVTGIDLMSYLLHFAEQKKLRVFLYGAEEDSVSKARDNIEKHYPDITVAGYENGFDGNEDEVVQRIQDCQADVLFVALGSPKQELWIRRHKEKLGVKVFQGVGGSFDVWAGKEKKAPKLYRNLNVEWLYRLISDPKRIKRQLALPKFAFCVLTKSR
ncbi:MULTISPECIES: WecB/TagA/CpsF family glycosyltransferase [Salimicrobium]|uniref:N-acetylglucosaminyldiphosphoundecaprenol N-acetyl-beta-D-mannosaminyltransferase n=1 Tax=Salimicrobium humidisoli TaxID=2029857 RepID=A0ABX4HP93_9BACI|nr:MULTISPECIES: WecB/TagA/CpsF family glycosyltransferase [Salimicrobium]PBB04873.1 glycosyltransferase [Salimicrobium humidisoli]